MARGPLADASSRSCRAGFACSGRRPPSRPRFRWPRAGPAPGTAGSASGSPAGFPAAGWAIGPLGEAGLRQAVDRFEVRLKRHPVPLAARLALPGPVARGTLGLSTAFGGGRRACGLAGTSPYRDNMRLYSCGRTAAHYLFISAELVWNRCRSVGKSPDRHPNRPACSASEDRSVNFGRNLWIWAAVIVLLFVLFEMFQGGANPAGAAEAVKYSEFLNKVEAGEVTNVDDPWPRGQVPDRQRRLHHLCAGRSEADRDADRQGRRHQGRPAGREEPAASSRSCSGRRSSSSSRSGSSCCARCSPAAARPWASASRARGC